MNQIFFTAALILVGFLVSLPVLNRIPFSFQCFSTYLLGSLTWVITSCFLLVINHYNLTAIIIAHSVIILICFSFAACRKMLHIEINQIFGFLAVFSLYIIIAALVTHFNFSAATIDSATRIFVGKSLYWDGFIPENKVVLGSVNIFTSAIQSAGEILDDQYIFTFQPMLALSLIGMFISITLHAQKSIFNSQSFHRIFSAILFLSSTYFIAFQAFYIHDNLVMGVFYFVGITSFWLAMVENNSAWLFFGSLSALGMSLARSEGPVFALILLAIAISQDNFAFRTRLKTYIFPSITISAWYFFILMAVNYNTRILKPERVSLFILAFCGLAILTLFSKTDWIRKKVFPIIPPAISIFISLAFIGLFILKPQDMWINLSMITSNMFENGRWGIFWYLILMLCFFSILLPKIPKERLFSNNITSFFLLLVIFGGLRSSPFRLGWSDSANRMLVQVAPALMIYLSIKYTNAWQTTREQTQFIIKKKLFPILLVIPVTLLIMAGFFWAIKPINYVGSAKVISGADEFTENHPFSSALREDKNSKYAETQSAGDFTVVIDLQKLVHANIIELSVESVSTDASAQRMLSDIGWAVSSDNANWTVIYQPPSTNMTNVRLVHNSRFQYPVGQVESFRYVRMTFKPVNPEERLKIKEINIWSHSPDGYYPDK